MSAMSPVSKDSPLWKAWEQYVASEEYANSKKWAVMPEHTEGSMWAAFDAGFRARAPQEAGEARALLRALETATGEPWCPVEAVAKARADAMEEAFVGLKVELSKTLGQWRAEVLEDAAKIAKGIECDETGRCRCNEHIAAAIRAEKEKA